MKLDTKMVMKREYWKFEIFDVVNGVNRQFNETQFNYTELHGFHDTSRKLDRVEQILHVIW